nr:hypothetical protein [Tanacetum cinerariifolium]
MTNPKDIMDPTTAMNMALVLMAKAFKLNYSTPTNNNQRVSSNPRNKQIAQPGMNMGQDRQMQMIGGNGGNQFRQYAGQNAGNLNRYNAVQNVRKQVAQNPRVQNDGIQNQIRNAPDQDQSSFNQNYLQQPMTNPEYITDPTTAMNMALALMAKAFKLNYSTPTNNNQRISSNPRNMQTQGTGRLLNWNGNLVASRAEGNAAGQNGNQIRCYNCRGVGHYARNCTIRPRRRDAAYLQTQLLIAQKEEAGIQLQAEEYDLMAAAADLDEIKEVNANYILMANLQQASTSGTQTDSAPIYDTD